MAKRAWRRMDRDMRRRIIRRAARGATYDEIHEELGVARSSIGLVVKQCGGVFRREQWECSAFRLSLAERIEIYLGLQFELTFTAIAAGVGRAVSTVSREVNGHGGRVRYRPVLAHRAAELAARRPKSTVL